MKIDVFQQYADLKREMAILQDKLKEIEPIVKEEMKDENKISFDFGTFFYSSRKKWTYTDNVKIKEEELKKIKKEEEKQSIAKCEESKILMFKGK